MPTCTITIGRNHGPDQIPLAGTDWYMFKYAIANEVDLCCAYDPYVEYAESLGEWNGKREDSVTWVFAADPPQLAVLRAALSKIATDYGQDAIALTVGTTELIGPVPYRHDLEPRAERD